MIRLEHVGACMIVVDGKKYLPGDTIDVESISAGLKCLIAEGRLVIESDTKATKEIVSEVKSKVKRKEAKSITEAEVGNEYK